ncbi:hypothetical protein SOV_48380 [Sporomusa ovata DSM 2662]|nr:hypothetical protein SOV_2c01070 [Sporomusa ovata DSM 2662]
MENATDGGHLFIGGRHLLYCVAIRNISRQKLAAYITTYGKGELVVSLIDWALYKTELIPSRRR